jgi:phosphatidylinositol-4-phosphate 3-kinase
MLPLVLSSVPDWTYQNLPEIYQLLANWTPMLPVDAMVLLKAQFPDQMVRETAVRWMECFSDDELCDYLPQLVQALKYESYHNSPLAR